jgi:hypothetical protein
MDIEQLSKDPRVTVHRSGQPAHDGTAVVYWMQRAQRASDNPALETAIAAANAIGKPVVVYFALVAGAVRAKPHHGIRARAAIPSGRFWLDRAPQPTHLLPFTVEEPRDRARLWRACERLAGLGSRSSRRRRTDR